MNNQNRLQGQGTMSMTAPAKANTKRDDVELVPAGPNPCILYSIIDMGTVYNQNFRKEQRTVRLTFEFPLFKQLFRTTDTEPKPTVLSVEETFLMSPGSNLKKWCDAMSGTVLQEHDYKNGYDIGQFLGRAFMGEVDHVPGKKDPTKIYANLTTAKALTEDIRARYNFDWSQLIRTNDTLIFAIDPNGNCFQSDAFARLPKFLRERIMKSNEALAYERAGGVFRDQEKPSDQKQVFPAQQPQQRQVQQPVQQSQPVQPQPAQTGTVEIPTDVVQNGHRLVMIVNDFTYDQYLAVNYTPELLIRDKKAVWVPDAPQVPGPSAPQQPQAPQAPQSPVASSPQPGLPEGEEDDDIPF